ncbi:MAG: hypothetical protein J07HB67_01596 [halophilic archaeon J07HB67]|jgi:hypothetical protein|nr:MAG: hypothetical protein J07HB67_01596 [halophilic archaeon J07HB67]
MAEFDPEQFEDKYAHYFTELQRAYKNAFEVMNDTYDSELIHAIDQQVLNESEPFYDEATGFRVELPDEPTARLTAIVVDDERLHETLDRYVAEIETQLYDVFDVERPDDAEEP